jgi:mRNA-degrading endonuclease toxin of MazEF toxin-antitoxin module
LTSIESNGIEKPSAIDALQVKSVSTARFTRKTGSVSSELINEVVAAVAGIIEYN